MKTAAAFALLLTACGLSPCDQFARDYCDKQKACVSPRWNPNACEETAKRAIAAASRTDAQCMQARYDLAAMDCGTFIRTGN